MAFKYNPLSGQIEDQQQGPQGPAGTMTSSAGGTAGTPGYNFSGDTNSGFYSVGADSIGISTGGTQRVVINGDGELGVGTPDPFGPFHVRLATDKNIYFTTSPSETGNVATLQGINNAGSGLASIGFRATDLRFATQAAERLRIASDGNLGIGTSTPDQLIHINKASGTTLFKASVAGNSTLGIELQKTGATTQSWRIADGQTINGKLEFYDVTDSATRMCIDGDGRIGIGTINPTSRLHVSGSGIQQGIIGSTDGTAAWLILDGDGNGDGLGGDYSSITHSSSGLEINNRKATPIIFKNMIGGSETEALRISDGKVCIGTTTEGHTSADDLTVATSGHTGITLRSGTGSAGSIYFSNATSGGNEYNGYIIYDQSNDSLRFGTNENTRLNIDQNGKVSIGETTAHTYNAHVAVDDLVVGGGSSHGITVLTGNTSTGSLWFDAQDATRGYIQYAHNEQSLILGTEGNERVRIKADGKTGIGTSSPDTILHVEGTGSAFKVQDNTGSIGATKTVTAEFKREDSSRNPRLQVLHNQDGSTIHHTWSSAAPNLMFDVGGTEMMRITNNGKVSIGDAATHTYSAHSEGDDLVIGGAGWRGMTIYGTNGGVIQFADAGGNRDGQIIYDHGNGSMYFRANGNVNRLIINSSGNVGIGVTPSAWGVDDFKALQIGTGFAAFGRGTGDEDRGGITVNSYHDGNAIKYIGNGHSNRIYMNDGNIDFQYAASGTAGNTVTYTSGIKMKADGAVGIGTTSPTTLLEVGNVHGDSNRGAVAIKAGAVSGLAITHANIYLEEEGVAEGWYLGVNSDGDLQFCNSGSTVPFTLIDADDTAAFTSNLSLASDKYLKFNGSAFTIRENAGNNYINSQTGSLYLQGGGNTAVEVKNNKDVEFSGNVSAKRLSLTHDGASSPLLHVQGDDGGPWAVCIGNQTYSDSSSHGLHLYQANGGNVLIQNIGKQEDHFNEIKFSQSDGETSKDLLTFGTDQSATFGGILKSPATYSNTTSNAANVALPNSDGQIYRSTSSRKYKDNIITLTDSDADKILNCRPVSFTSKCDNDDKSKIHYGLIAEEVAEIDSRLVNYNTIGVDTPEVEGVQYDRFIPHLINLIKRQSEKITVLETKVAALESN